jgi:sulfur-carrier protein adenylyltransferase/sulfurtransferase
MTGTLPPLVEPAAELTKDEVARYSRHLIIPDVGVDGQKRLKNARVLVIGAGGLGSPALLYLAAAGVGTLGTIDFDVVDESNLQRQIIHGQSDVGKPKAQSAQESVAEVNPFVNFVVHNEQLTNDNALDIFADYDLILDGTDNFATRYLVNDAAVIQGKPYVWGSIFRFEGQVSVFWEDAPDGRGLNYRDLYPEPPPPGMVPSCAEGGVLGVLCASIGSIMVNEAIKLITGIGDPLIGRMLIYDALEARWQPIKINKDPECPVCGKNPTVTELIDYEAFCGVPAHDREMDAHDVADEWEIDATELEQIRDKVTLIDVREPHEYEIARIPGAELIPLGELPSRMRDLDSSDEIVLHCKSGARSMQALELLRGAGFTKLKNLRGGINAYSRDVDPSVPTY